VFFLSAPSPLVCIFIRLKWSTTKYSIPLALSFLVLLSLGALIWAFPAENLSPPASTATAASLAEKVRSSLWISSKQISP
jgi:hypothetical protein